MAEYIEKAELIKKLCFETAEWYYSPTIKTIKEFPAADVQPVKHGQWIEHNDWIECNVCGFEVNDIYCEKRDMTCTETSYDYCPKCGARMDGDTE